MPVYGCEVHLPVAEVARARGQCDDNGHATACRAHARRKQTTVSFVLFDFARNCCVRVFQCHREKTSAIGLQTAN